MARLPRIVIPAYPHHVIQRGNNRQAVFFTDNDYRFFLECLREAKGKYSCRIYAYVLMTNHVHLLVDPEKADNLGRFMQSVGRRYVRYINQTYRRTGTLWEGRFKSAVVSRDAYLIVCSRYIELNPVRAGMVSDPGQYPWSSYLSRALGSPDRLLDEDPWYAGLGRNAQERQRIYGEWVRSGIRKGEWDQIRKATQQGRVIGGEGFKKQVERVLGRRVVGELRGRPRTASVAPENVL
ncbi:MAG: transposase [Nitrospirae bacterium]|nr:transposase [Nitrospirota bacterium]